MSYARALSSLGCPELSLKDVLALANAHRIGGLELRSLAGTTDLPGSFARVYGSPAVLAAQLQAATIKICGLNTSFKLAGATTAERDSFLQFLPWAEALGGVNLRVFDGGQPSDRDSLSVMAETMAWWRELRVRHGWKTDIIIETHDSLFTASAIEGFVRLVPSTKILWDTHHTWKKGGEDPVATWHAIKAHVAHIHVKDSISQPSAKHPFTYVLPGDGEFPMAPLREVLQAEYTGMVSLEWEKLWHPYLPTLDEALTVAAKRAWW